MDPLQKSLFDVLTPLIVNAFLAVSATVIGVVGLQVRKLLKSHANNSNSKFLGRLAEIAVQAAEQVFDAGAGEEKKAYAIDFIQDRLDEYGIKVNALGIEKEIEAAVMREFNYPLAVSPAEPPTETVVEMAATDLGDTDSA